MSCSETTTVDIKVEMGCACKGCKKKLKKSVESMKGVKSVNVKRHQGKLTVVGSVDPDDVLERVMSRTNKKAEFWPKESESPDENSAHSCNATPSFSEGINVNYNSQAINENYTTVFSDENPNACTIV